MRDGMKACPIIVRVKAAPTSAYQAAEGRQGGCASSAEAERDGWKGAEQRRARRGVWGRTAGEVRVGARPEEGDTQHPLLVARDV